METEATFEAELSPSHSPRVHQTLDFLHAQREQFGSVAANSAAIDIVAGCLCFVLDTRGERALRALLCDVAAASNAAIAARKLDSEGLCQ